jgi:hypothetical protein
MKVNINWKFIKEESLKIKKKVMYPYQKKVISKDNTEIENIKKTSQIMPIKSKLILDHPLLQSVQFMRINFGSGNIQLLFSLSETS